MNAKDIMESSGNEVSNIDDDFDNLFEQEEKCIDSEKETHDFNELFEQISEELTDSVEGIVGDSPGGNVDEDFEALLSDEIPNVSTQDHNEAKTELDNETFVGKHDAKDDEQETLVGKSVTKGFNEIFSSDDTSDELMQKFSDTKFINSNPTKEQVIKY